MGSNENSPKGNTIITQLLNIIKEISSLSECKNSSKRLYSNLVRRVKLLSPLFEELVDREDEDVELLSVDQVHGLELLLYALISAKTLLKQVQESSKLFQAVQRDKVSSKFLDITGQIEGALSKISYDRLDLSEEVQEQVILLIWLTM
ncbi:U-box domain-containing protein 14 [Bienertia sinuspersici]